MVFASFLGVISNTDHRHFCLPNFPEALNHTSVANQLSSFTIGKFHFEAVKVFATILTMDHKLSKRNFCCYIDDGSYEIMSDEEDNIMKGIKHFSTITQDSEVRD